MSLTIRSPHSGQAVKVREQDIGRALRDEGGRVFYVVPFSEGDGYYGSITRKGSPKDEQRYRQGNWKLTTTTATTTAAPATGSSATGSNTPTPTNSDADPTNASASPLTNQVHDATGPGRKPKKSRLLIAAILLAGLGAGGWWTYQTYFATTPGNSTSGSSAPATPGSSAPGNPSLENPAPATTESPASGSNTQSSTTLPIIEGEQGPESDNPGRSTTSADAPNTTPTTAPTPQPLQDPAVFE